MGLELKLCICIHSSIKKLHHLKWCSFSISSDLILVNIRINAMPLVDRRQYTHLNYLITQRT